MRKKRKGGNPQYKPTPADRNTVKSMAACGMNHEVIARCIGVHGIDPKTLRKHFKDELETAAANANAVIGNVAFQKALNGEAWAVCFWLKCRAHWQEVNRVELTGKDGATLIPYSAIDTLLHGNTSTDE